MILNPIITTPVWVETQRFSDLDPSIRRQVQNKEWTVVRTREGRLYLIPKDQVEEFLKIFDLEEFRQRRSNQITNSHEKRSRQMSKVEQTKKTSEKCWCGRKYNKDGDCPVIAESDIYE